MMPPSQSGFHLFDPVTNLVATASKPLLRQRQTVSIRIAWIILGLVFADLVLHSHFIILNVQLH